MFARYRKVSGLQVTLEHFKEIAADLSVEEALEVSGVGEAANRASDSG